MGKKTVYTTGVLFGSQPARNIGVPSTMLGLVDSILKFKPYSDIRLFGRLGYADSRGQRRRAKGGIVTDRLLGAWLRILQDNLFADCELRSVSAKSNEDPTVFAQVVWAWSPSSKGQPQNAGRGADSCITLAVSQRLLKNLEVDYVALCDSLAASIQCTYGFVERGREWGIPLFPGASLQGDLMDTRWRDIPYKEYCGKYSLKNYVSQIRWVNYLAASHFRSGISGLGKYTVVEPITKGLYRLQLANSPDTHQQKTKDIEAALRMIPERR
jgi:hypothetical protein